MKNGIEVRKNGNRVEIRDIYGYNVYKKQPDGSFVLSKNGPWDYLRNARLDADNDPRCKR